MKRYWQVLIILTLVFLAAVQPFSYSQSTPSQSVTTPNIKEDKENKGNKGISEWQGIIGAFLGFLAAFLAEPVKSNASNKLKIKQLRKSLYCEIVSIYDLCLTHKSPKQERKKHVTVSR